MVVQEFDTQVRVHMADYTDHTCMDYSPSALASGNTCGGGKKSIPELKNTDDGNWQKQFSNRYKHTCNLHKRFPLLLLRVQQEMW